MFGIYGPTQPAPTFRQPGEPSIRGAVEGSGARYAIRRGDTLSGIATARGISLSALIEANPGIAPNRLSIGQAIVIPAS